MEWRVTNVYLVSGEDLVSKQEIKVQEADEGWAGTQFSAGRPRSASTRRRGCWRRWLTNWNGRPWDPDLAWPALSANERPESATSPPWISSSARQQPPHHPQPRPSSAWGNESSPSSHGRATSWSSHASCLHVPVARLPPTTQHAAGHQAAPHDAPHPHFTDATHGIPQLSFLVQLWRQHEPTPRSSHISATSQPQQPPVAARSIRVSFCDFVVMKMTWGQYNTWPLETSLAIVIGSRPILNTVISSCDCKQEQRRKNTARYIHRNETFLAWHLSIIIPFLLTTECYINSLLEIIFMCIGSAIIGIEKFYFQTPFSSFLSKNICLKPKQLCRE